MRRFGIVITAVVFFSLLAASQSHADPTYWTGTTGSWHDPLNWDNGIPTISDQAYIDNGGTAQIFADAESYYLHAGYNNSGAVEQTGGIHTINRNLYLGYESGSSGTYNLSGAGELYVGLSEFVGYDGGTGEFNQTGGIHTVGYLYVKDDSSYTLSGGILSIGDNAEIYGSFHFTDNNWALNINGGLANFENAVIDGAGSASFTSAVNTLTIFPTGFDPVAQFGLYNALGLVHNAGSTLVISSGEGFAGRGYIGDSVECQGTIVASGGPLVLNGNILISNGGTLDLCNYNLTVDNGATATIAASGGELSVGSNEYIGYASTGAFNQDGGINTVSNYLCLGYDYGSSGTYSLSAGELSVGSNEYIGGEYRSGTGEFNQTGGTHTVGNYLYLGYDDSSSGTYNLSEGVLTVGDKEYIGYNGTGEFNQTGGTHTVGSYLSIKSSGTYNLSAGELSVGSNEYVIGSTGVFNQTGGTHTVNGDLEISSSSTYNLSAGVLTVGSEYVGDYSMGQFNQTGGTHTVGYLYIKDDSSFTLSSGTLSINASVEVNGSFHFTNGDWVLNVEGGLANFTNATIDSAGSASFTSATNTLTIFPTGFDPAAQFGSYNALGLVHNAGSTLVISAGEGFAGRGWIGDYVQNSGNIVASGGSLDFKGGLTISDGGTLDSSNYDLTVENGATVTIAASGGELLAESEYIGYDGTGEFNQNGGFNTVSDYLYLGSSGTYNLSAGALSSRREYISNGEFNQTGGTHTVSSYLYLGYSSGSSGTYNLSTGELSAGSAYIGYNGTGEFNQNGGTNTVGNSLHIGYSSNSSGTYNLSAGELSVGSEYIGYNGTGQFNQTGGTHTVGYLYVKDDSSYILSGGTLSINTSVEVNGSFHFNDSDVVLTAGGLINFTNAVIDGAGSASFTSAVNSLIIFPTGFDPVAEFGSYNALGLVHNAGSTLVISAGEGFAGRGWIGDHVQNRGNIVASGGSLDFRGGLTIFDGGTLDSSSYGLTVDNGTTVTIAASGGELSASYEYIGSDGTGEFNQDGGIHAVGTLCLGRDSGSSGTYNLRAGELSVSSERIGYEGTGEFNQTGGSHIVGGSLYLGYHYNYDLYSGYYSYSSGTCNLSAGELSVGDDEYIGYEGTGEFNQTGGIHTVGGELLIGTSSGTNTELPGYTLACTGIYNMSGGVLEIIDLVIGDNGSFNVLDNSAVINVGGSGGLTIEENAKYYAVPGTVIHMNGAGFVNQSLSSADVAGLRHSTFIYEGSAPGTTFEVSGFDMGPVAEGFANNFALGGLAIGNEQVGYIRLVDNYLNYIPEGPQTQSEALYVKKLVLGARSTLDLNGYHLYTLEYTDNGGTVLNGEINVIPEPATIALISAGLLGLAGLAQRKCRSIGV